jgi:hypothetical protein
MQQTQKHAREDRCPLHSSPGSQSKLILYLTIREGFHPTAPNGATLAEFELGQGGSRAVFLGIFVIAPLRLKVACEMH